MTTDYFNLDQVILKTLFIYAVKDLGVVAASHDALSDSSSLTFFTHYVFIHHYAFNH